jgi:hypothetical protein
MTVDSCCAWSSLPEERAATRRSRSSRGVPVRRATANRAGALSGKSNDTLRRAANGSNCRAARSKTTSVNSDAMATIPTHSAAVHGPVARGNAWLKSRAAAKESATGPPKMSTRSPRLSSGLRCHSPGSRDGQLPPGCPDTPSPVNESTVAPLHKSAAGGPRCRSQARDDSVLREWTSLCGIGEQAGFSWCQPVAGLRADERTRID